MLLLNDNAFRFFKEALKQSLEQTGARSESVKCPLSIWIYRVFSVTLHFYWCRFGETIGHIMENISKQKTQL